MRLFFFFFTITLLFVSNVQAQHGLFVAGSLNRTRPIEFGKEPGAYYLPAIHVGFEAAYCSKKLGFLANSGRIAAGYQFQKFEYMNQLDLMDLELEGAKFLESSERLIFDRRSVFVEVANVHEHFDFLTLNYGIGLSFMFSYNQLAVTRSLTIQYDPNYGTPVYQSSHPHEFAAQVLPYIHGGVTLFSKGRIGFGINSKLNLAPIKEISHQKTFSNNVDSKSVTSTFKPFLLTNSFSLYVNIYRFKS